MHEFLGRILNVPNSSTGKESPAFAEAEAAFEEIHVAAYTPELAEEVGRKAAQLLGIAA